MGTGFLAVQQDLLAASRELADVAADLEQLRGSLAPVAPPAAAYAHVPQSQAVVDADALCGAAIERDLSQERDRAHTVSDGVMASAQGYTTTDLTLGLGYQSLTPSP